MQGFYIYCVGGKSTHWSRLKQFAIPITDRSIALEVVSYKNVEAVVGQVPLQDFTEPNLRKHLANEQWLTEKVLAHERIVREMMLGTPPIIPLKFGTIFQSRARVQQMLKKHYSRFQNLLEQFTGRHEWGLKIFSRPQILKRKITAQDTDIARIVSKIKKQSAGKKYFFEKELEAKYREKIEEKERAAAENLQGLIVPFCDQYVSNNVLSRRFPGQDGELITNATLLIVDTSIDELRQYLNHWNQLHDKAGLTAELSGPWPPYNFVQL